MYLILPKDDALSRNNEESISRGCQPPTIYWWASTELADGNIALHVDDGNGLTDDEIAQCVKELPNGSENVDRWGIIDSND